MHAALVFFEVWGFYVAVFAVILSVGLWAGSRDQDALGKRGAADWIRAIYWPLIWLYLGLTGKDVLNRGLSPTISSLADELPHQSAASKPKVFKSVRAAKEYLAGRITEQAVREGSPLTEVERKMLYFSETGWTLPDMMKLSEEFDRGYDHDEYEEKIRALVSRLHAAEDQLGAQAWDDAVVRLSEGDHYLLVLINAGRPVTPASKWLPVLLGPVKKSRGDTGRLILFALAVSGLTFLFFLVRAYFMGLAGS
jgi:hypothetical protein